MAKGQMRVPKEKKKPKADKEKPKQLSAYKLAQQGSSSSANPFGNPPGKEGVELFQRTGSVGGAPVIGLSAVALAISRQVSNST